jgi:hypothetical protein
MVLHCWRTKPQDTRDAELHSDAVPTVRICDVALPVFFPFLAKDHIPQRRLWGRPITFFLGLRFCTSVVPHSFCLRQIFIICLKQVFILCSGCTAAVGLLCDPVTPLFWTLPQSPPDVSMSYATREIQAALRWNLWARIVSDNFA